MRRVVIIDGENLNRGLRNLIGSVDNPAPRSVLETFNYRQLINTIAGEEVSGEVLYFGAKLKKYDFDSEILHKSQEAIKWQSRHVNLLRSQGISFIKAGYLRARENKPCEACGHTKWILAEKGLDVGIATRLISEASQETEIILFSADTDLVPAVKEATKKGARVVFVGYEYHPALALAKAATVTRLLTRPMLQEMGEK